MTRKIEISVEELMRIRNYVEDIGEYIKPFARPHQDIIKRKLKRINGIVKTNVNNAYGMKGRVVDHKCRRFAPRERFSELDDLEL